MSKVGRDTPTGGLFLYLVEVMSELSKPGLDSDQISQHRARVYAVSVALRLIESAELEETVNKLSERLALLEGTWRPS